MTLEGAAPTIAIAPGAATTRVLVVEDNAAEARLACEWLREKGNFGVQIAGRLTEALDVLGRDRFDAITIDLNLPDSSGLATFRAIHSAAPDTPAVIVTGYNDEPTALDAMHDGAQDYLVKDAAMAVLLPRAVKYAIERHRLVSQAHQLHTRLQQAHRLEALGTLAGGIAHDFNNLLTAIIGYYELVKNQFPDESETAADLAEIGKAAKTAASLTQQLLAFARAQPTVKAVIDLNDLVRDFRRTIVSMLGNNVVAEFILGSEPLRVEVDRAQMHQVLLNLAANARDAMPNGGRAVLTTKQDADGSVARLTFSDTGRGMDAETQARIFEPFFTTKGLGRGTGLGLSTVHGIIESTGGTISVASAPGRGTTFTIDLPLTDRECNEETAADRGDRAVSGTVLLIEDEDAVRSLITKTLIRERFEVIAVPTGRDALVLAETGTSTPALILSDVVLSDCRAQTIIPRLKARWPLARVVLMSGYTEGHDSMAIDFDAFLPKPFTPTDAVAVLRQVLEGRS